MHKRETTTANKKTTVIQFRERYHMYTSMLDARARFLCLYFIDLFVVLRATSNITMEHVRSAVHIIKSNITVQNHFKHACIEYDTRHGVCFDDIMSSLVHLLAECTGVTTAGVHDYNSKLFHMLLDEIEVRPWLILLTDDIYGKQVDVYKELLRQFARMETYMFSICK